MRRTPQENATDEKDLGKGSAKTLKAIVDPSGEVEGVTQGGEARQVDSELLQRIPVQDRF